MHTSEPRLPAEANFSALPKLWAAARDELRARREARAGRKRLERELAAYTTQADLDDLYAVLDNHDDADTAVVRDILTRQQWQRTAAWPPAPRPADAYPTTKWLWALASQPARRFGDRADADDDGVGDGHVEDLIPEASCSRGSSRIDASPPVDLDLGVVVLRRDGGDDDGAA
jgi:hypothetical protein